MAVRFLGLRKPQSWFRTPFISHTKMIIAATPAIPRIATVINKPKMNSQLKNQLYHEETPEVLNAISIQ